MQVLSLSIFCGYLSVYNHLFCFLQAVVNVAPEKEIFVLFIYCFLTLTAFVFCTWGHLLLVTYLLIRYCYYQSVF